MAVTKWTLADPTDLTSHTFELNPPKSAPQGEIDFEHPVAESYMDDNGPMLTLSQPKDLNSQFRVDTLTRSEYETLWTWYDKGDLLTLTDDLGRVMAVYLTSFDAKRQRKANFPWFHEVTVGYLINDLEDV